MAGASYSSARLGHGLPGENQHWVVRPEVLRCAKVTAADLDECTQQAQKDFAVRQAAAPSA